LHSKEFSITEGWSPTLRTRQCTPHTLTRTDLSTVKTGDVEGLKVRGRVNRAFQKTS
jgi:hypothetical protein